MSNNPPRIIQHTRDANETYAKWDTLGFDTAREGFLSVIRNVSPPITIGLYGAWGSGKTEMIHALETDLKATGNHLVISFDAWKYRNERNLILPLMCAIERRYASDTEAVKGKARKVITTLALLAANQYIKQKVGIDVGQVRAGLELYEAGYKHYRRYDDGVASVETEYREFVTAIVRASKGEKLIVFIDNLDRCLPDVVVTLLEDISSFLSIEGVPCIYVLAMDHENVVRAIRHRNPNFNGTHYLEKIVQIGLRMPLPCQEKPGSSKSGLYHFMKRYELAMGYKTKSADGDERDKVFKQLLSINRVFAGLLGNPRRMERVVNKLMILESMGIFRVENSAEDMPVALFLILLKEHFPDVYESLKEKKDFEYLETVLQMSIQGGTTPFELKQEGPKQPRYIKNELIYNTYCNENEFYGFLREFSELNCKDFLKTLERLNEKLQLVG